MLRFLSKVSINRMNQILSIPEQSPKIKNHEKRLVISIMYK